MTDAFKLGFMQKVAELKKQADPPNRGLNDPNPLKRKLYRDFGYLAPTQSTYIGVSDPYYSKHFLRGLYDQLDAANAWNEEQKQNEKPYDVPGDQQLDRNAAVYDYIRSIGGTGNRYNPRFLDPNVETTAAAKKMMTARNLNEGSGRQTVTLGPWPAPTDEAIRHELGHAADEQDYIDAADKAGRRYTSHEFSMQPEMQREVAAWDKAGIPEDNEYRKAALSAYWPVAKYRETHDPSYMQLAQATNRDVLNAILERARAQYESPEILAERYASKGIPLIYDYRTALENKKDIPYVINQENSRGVYDSVFPQLSPREFIDDETWEAIDGGKFDDVNNSSKDWMLDGLEFPEEDMKDMPQVYKDLLYKDKTGE